MAGHKSLQRAEDVKPASHITSTGIGHWSEADFFRAMREGKRPDGSTIDPFIPVQVTRLMTDGDIRALWQYLIGVQRKDFGGR